MNIIEKDILTVEFGIICQSVNCLGMMGGLAGAIKRKWPSVEKCYLEKFTDKRRPFEYLGDVQLVKVDRDLFVANIFGQWHIGTKERQTDYCAISKGLETLKYDLSFTASCNDVYFPYLFCCGLGGGKWELVSEIIDFYFPNAIICKLND